ncbi:MAG: hypothetical protein OEV59_09270 [Deltaproteobacteria bacterium]|nr:hypothetical protein [Deltaproteobacteria bacterium]
MSKVDVCPTCGRSSYKGNKYTVPVIAGGVIGFIVGTGFVAYWFGTEAGFTHNMALIHEISGTVLGLLGGLIYGAIRK